MLPEAPLLLEPLEYPPPNPPPLAFAKDRVGTPISEITITAPMSFVMFKIRFLSIDVQVSKHLCYLSRYGLGKPIIRKSPGCTCTLCRGFSLPLAVGVAGRLSTVRIERPISIYGIFPSSLAVLFTG